MSLYLSRKKRHAIVLFTSANERITFWFEGEERGQYKLRFKAPKSVNIVRTEVLERGYHPSK